MQILYGAMKDGEIMTIAQVKHAEELKKKREKMSYEAKMAYKMSKLNFERQNIHIS
jgi:hypothetical protein